MTPNELASRPVKQGLLSDHLVLLGWLFIGGPLLPLILLFAFPLILFTKIANWFYKQPGYIRHIAFLPGAEKGSKKRLIGVLCLYIVLPLLSIWIGTVYSVLYANYLEWYTIDIVIFTLPLSVLIAILFTLWLRGKYFFFRKPFDPKTTYSNQKIRQTNSKVRRGKTSVFKRNRLLLLLLVGFGPILVVIFPIGITLLFNKRFRTWFRRQPGYIYHLSYLPGMGQTSKRRLILGMMFYFALPVLISWLFIFILLFIGFFENHFGTILLATSPLSLASMIIAYAWLTGKAGFFHQEVLTAVHSKARTDSLVGNTASIRKANIERFLGFSTLAGLMNSQKRGASLAYKLRSLPKWVWICLILYGAPALFLSYIYGGWLVGLVGMLLSFIPAYRRWLHRQPGTINRLSLFRGWRATNPFILAFVHFAYLVLPTFLLFVVIEELSYVSGFFLEISWFAISTFPFGLPLLVGWFIRFWQIPVPGINRLLGLNHDIRQWHKMLKTAVIHKENHDYNEGIAVLKDALAFTAKRFGPNHFTRGKTYRDLGQLYLLSGEYSEAVTCYQAVINICELGFGSANIHTANSQYRLGKLYIHLGHFTQAIPHFKMAIHAYRMLGAEKNPAYARAFNDLGFAYLNLNHTEIAQALFEEAADMQEERFLEDWLDTVNHLALLFTHLEAYNEAGAYFELLDEKADQIPDQVNSWVWVNRGYYCQKVGNYDEALKWTEQALENERALYHDNHLSVGKYLRQLADILREMGAYTRALNHYNDAQGIYYIHGELNHPEFFNCLHGLAKLQAATGHYLEAFHSLKQAIDSEEKMIGTILGFGSENGRLAYLQSQHDKMILFLELIRQHLITEPEALQAAGIILRRQSLIADMAGVLKQVQFSENRETKKILRKLNILKEKMSRLEADGKRQEESRFVYQRNMLKMKAEQERLETELSQKLPYDETMNEINKASWQTISESDKFPDGGLLMQFVYGKRYDFTAVLANGELNWGEPCYMLFTLQKGEETPRCYDLGSATGLETAVTNIRLDIKEVRKSLSRGVTDTDMGTYLENGTALYELLIAPFASKLGLINHLFIVPDGMLTSLPFEILPINNSRYMLDRFTISYLSSARDLLRDNVANSQNEPLIVAAPEYNLAGSKILADGKTAVRQAEIVDAALPNSDDEEMEELLDAAPYLTRSSDHRGGMTFLPLANTYLEGTKIAKLLDVEAKLKDNANENIIKDKNSPSILHIATHGFFLKKKENIDQNSTSRFDHLSQQNNPLVRAGLALAGANRWLRKDDKGIGGENGILFGMDVVGLDLSGTKLVVLSACDTGLGEYVDGEGVFGLRRAFVMAGAQTLVMSMWKVPDEQTQELMVEFYNQLLSDVPRAQALRNAQIKVKSQAKTAHPYFWGAFICQGDFTELNG